MTKIDNRAALEGKDELAYGWLLDHLNPPESMALVKALDQACIHASMGQEPRDSIASKVEGVPHLILERDTVVTWPEKPEVDPGKPKKKVEWPGTGVHEVISEQVLAVAYHNGDHSFEPVYLAVYRSLANWEYLFKEDDDGNKWAVIGYNGKPRRNIEYVIMGYQKFTDPDSLDDYMRRLASEHNGKTARDLLGWGTKPAVKKPKRRKVDRDTDRLLRD